MARKRTFEGAPTDGLCDRPGSLTLPKLTRQQPICHESCPCQQHLTDIEDLCSSEIVFVEPVQSTGLSGTDGDNYLNTSTKHFRTNARHHLRKTVNYDFVWILFILIVSWLLYPTRAYSFAGDVLQMHPKFDFPFNLLMESNVTLKPAFTVHYNNYTHAMEAKQYTFAPSIIDIYYTILNALALVMLIGTFITIIAFIRKSVYSKIALVTTILSFVMICFVTSYDFDAVYYSFNNNPTSKYTLSLPWGQPHVHPYLPTSTISENYYFRPILYIHDAAYDINKVTVIQRKNPTRKVPGGAQADVLGAILTTTPHLNIFVTLYLIYHHSYVLQQFIFLCVLYYLYNKFHHYITLFIHFLLKRIIDRVNVDDAEGHQFYTHTTPFTAQLHYDHDIPQTLNIGDTWFIPNKPSLTIQNHTFITTENGVNVVNTDGNTVTSYDYPKKYYSEYSHADANFIYYKIKSSIITEFFYQTYCRFLTGQWFINQLRILFVLWMDVASYNANSLYDARFISDRRDYAVIMDDKLQLCWHFDFEQRQTTFINSMTLDRVMLQVRNTSDESKFTQRVCAALNSLAILNKLSFSPQYTIAVCHYAAHCYNYITENKTYRDYKYNHPFLQWWTRIKIFFSLLYNPSYEHKLMNTIKKTATCFFTNNFKDQKPNSFVTSTMDCCSSETQHWYAHINHFHKHILYPKKCICNAIRATKNRQCCQMGEYDPKAAIELLKWTQQNISKLLPITNYQSQTQADWVESVPSTKRLQKQQAIDNNNEAGVLTSKQTEVKAFMKIEPLNRKDKHLSDCDQPIDPRLISGRYSEYDVIGGPIIKRITKLIASMWSYTYNQIVPGIMSRVKGITYFSTGHNKISIGGWFKRHVMLGRCRWFNTDYKRFDASTARYLIELEADIYNAFCNDPNFRAWLIAQFTTLGTIEIKDGKDILKVIYGCDGTRKSGDQNTSIGNTMINVLVQVFALSKQYPNIIDLLNNEEIALLVLGDDTVMVIHGDPNGHKFNMQTHVNVSTQLGLQMDIEERHEYDVSFCSSYFVPAKVNGEESYILTQKLGRNLSRSYTTEINYGKSTKPWIKSNAYAYSQDYRHIPAMYNFHHSIWKSIGGKEKALSLRDEYKHLPRNYKVEKSDNLETWLMNVYHINHDQLGTILNKLPKQDALADNIINVDIYGESNPIATGKPNVKFVGGTFEHRKRPIPISTNSPIHDTAIEVAVQFDISIPDVYIIGDRRFDSKTHNPPQNMAATVPQRKPPIINNVINDCKIEFTTEKNSMTTNLLWDDSIDYPTENGLTPNEIDFTKLPYLSKLRYKRIDKAQKHPSRHPYCRVSRYAALGQFWMKFRDEVPDVFDIGTRPLRNYNIVKKFCNINDITYDDFYGCQPNSKQCVKVGGLDKFAHITKSTLAEATSNGEFNATNTLLMVDVLYYIPPNELFRAVVRCKSLYSIHCRFYDFAGSTINNEVTWTTTNNNTTYTILDRDDKTGKPIDRKYTHDTLKQYLPTNYKFTDYDGKQYNISKALVYANDVYDIWCFTKL